MNLNCFKRALLLPVFILMNFTLSFAQLRINEISPSNISQIINSNGKYNDWIEIYNNGPGTVNLAGYGLSDDYRKPYQFTFPNVSLTNGKRILVFASDSNSTMVVDHWEMGVNALSSWKYVSGSSTLDTNWRNNSFNDASWSTGNGGIGFGDGDDNTVIPVGTSVMMRKSFNVPDTANILKAVFMMDYDDGFVAYLNGVEIARANMGAKGTRPSWNTLASSSHEALMYQGQQPDSFFIDPVFLKSILRQGSNVLAVQTHNVSSTSTDLSSIPYLFFGMASSGTTFSATPSWFRAPAAEYFNAKFKLSKSGETVYLTSPSGTTVDQVTYGNTAMDNSYGRKPDGSNSWCYFATPTPDASNNSSVCYSGYASIPIFSVSGGFYPSTQIITLSTTTPGGVIRYSLNGNDPTASDPLYTSPITVSSTKVIRAKVFANGKLPSPTVTNTYVINENVQLPVFSITTDSLNLWDWNTGIYVMGPNAGSTSPYFGANFWQDWERPASIEYYDKGKNRVLRFDADIEIYGNYSRAKPQKSFEIKLSDRYGTGEVHYSFWPDKPHVDETDDIILRNSGTDWNVVHFRDAMMEKIMKNTNSGYLAAEPCVLYLNGQFWGIYTIHENHDERWMKNNFGLKKSEVDYLKEDGSSITVKEGSDDTFWTMYNYATTQNATTQQYFDYMNSVLDLPNYSDYFIAQTYYNNGDWIGEWTNNIKMWRPNAPGSKWRYLLYDTDFGMGLKGSVNDNRLSMARNPSAFSLSSEMFDAILNNPTYKRYFINRYADLINTIYLPSNVDKIKKQYQDSMSADMPAHFAKWGSNMTTWQSNMNSMMNFANSRPAIVRNQIKTLFGLNSQVTLTLNVSPAGAGRIEISTIVPDTYPWTGVYFNGNPVTITAIPNPGFTFTHWRSNITIPTNNPNQSATFNFTSTDQITAYFNGSPESPTVTISEINYNSSSSLNTGDWIELHNYGTKAMDISGWRFRDEEDQHTFTFPTGTVLAPGAYLVLVEDTQKFNSFYPGVLNKLGPLGFNLSNGGEEVRLFDHRDSLFLSFYYEDQAPWPTGADGGGYTCELLDPLGSLNDGNNWFQGCIGGSPGTAYTPILAGNVQITGSTTFCTGSNVTLSVGNDPSYTYQWKRNNSNIFGAIGNTYTATSAGDYSVQINSQGCSMITNPVTITVVSQGPDPVTNSAYRCGPGQLTLSATSTDSIFWYDAATGGNLVGIGNSFTTPVLQQSTNFYAVTSRQCPGNPVAAFAEILVQTAPPVTNDVSRCGPGTVTLTASDTAVMRWYNVPSGGAILFSGANYQTGVISSDSTFYVEAGTVCPSPRVEANVVIITTPEPVVTSAQRCGNGTVDLIAQAADPVFWYTSANGGTSIGSGIIFTTPPLTATDTFYAEANSGCASVRVMGIAIIDQIPAAPIGQTGYYCSNGTATLSASSTEQVYWYDAPSGGNLLHTGSVFTTPPLSSPATYYAEAGYTCRSGRTAIDAIAGTIPSAPAGVDNSRCGPGVVSISATSSDTVYWYTNPAGGAALGAGAVFITPSINATTVYYAEAANTCRSTNRTPVTATINSLPAPPAVSDVMRCGPGTLTLTASSSSAVSWYDAPSGGSPLATGLSFTTPSISSTTVYYAEAGNTCTSNRVSVNAIIDVMPSDPVVSNAQRCGPGTVTLMANSAAPVSWYTVSTGGSAIGNGLSFTTPVLSATTTFYAEAGNVCKSNRIAILVTINPITSDPFVNGAQRCGSGTLTLTATSSTSVSWYSTASGGSVLGTGLSFTTPSLSATTTYYAEAGTVCVSNRVPVIATVDAIPAIPQVSDVSACGPASFLLTAQSSSTVSWYNSASGGSSLGTGLTFTTPVLTSSTVYYAEAGTNCLSGRISVNVSILPVPAPPLLNGASHCGSGSVMLTASSTDSVFWYDAPTGGNLLGIGLSIQTPVLSNTATYYAEAGNGCRSSRENVSAVINPVTPDPVVQPAYSCGPASLLITASSPEIINWYDQPAGGNLLANGSDYITPFLTATTNYYVQAGTLCPSNYVLVQVNIHAVPNVNIGPDTIIIQSGQAITLDAGAGFAAYHWSTGTTGQRITVSVMGYYYVTVMDSNSCSASDTVFVREITDGPDSPLGTSNTSVYPNPCIERLLVSGIEQGAGKLNLSIINIQGQELLREEISLATGIWFREINVSTFAAGVYFLRLQKNERQEIHRLIKQ